MPVFHIDADAFFAAVEQGFNPALRGRPVVVGGSEDQRGVVHTASYEARALGIRTGMPLATAKRLCPAAVFLKGNYQHYQAASRTLQEIYLRYTPAVEFTSLDDAYLDFHGCEGLYSSWEGIAREIQQAVGAALGITVSIGIAANKLLARIASGQNNPAGVFAIPPGQEGDFLRPLCISELPGVGRKTRALLNDMGIERIGQLAKMPAVILCQLLGENGRKIWQYANGRDPREVQIRILPGQISRSTTFEEDLTETEVVMATFQYLGERIAATLRGQQQRCRKVEISIRYSDFSAKQASGTLRTPSDSAACIFTEARKLLDKTHLRRLRIRHVGIAVREIEWQTPQLTFEEEDRRSEELNLAVDHIRERFGFMAILPADTLVLQSRYRIEKNGYVLHAPALTR